MYILCATRFLYQIIIVLFNRKEVIYIIYKYIIRGWEKGDLTLIQIPFLRITTSGYTFGHSLSRVVVPATLHNSSVAAMLHNSSVA